MEKTILALIDDIKGMEAEIEFSIKEGTFSEHLMPSEPLESIAEEIQVATDDQGRNRKFIEVEIDGEMAEVDLWMMTTPEFILKPEDLDENKDMKAELTRYMSYGLGGLWDNNFLSLLNTATVSTGQIVFRDDDVATRSDIIETVNLMVEDVTCEPGGGSFLMHQSVFDSIPAWKDTEGEDDDYMSKAKEKCAESGVLFGLDLLMSAHRSGFKDVYCFKPEVDLGLSYRSRPEIHIAVGKDAIRISCRIMAARTITNMEGVSRSAPKPGGAPENIVAIADE